MYELSEKRKARDRNQTNWEKRMFILMKRKIGKWTFQRLADHYNCSNEAIQDIYRKIKGMTVEELEDEYNKFIDGKL